MESFSLTEFVPDVVREPQFFTSEKRVTLSASL